MKFGEFLLGLSGPIAKKVLVSLGIGVVTTVGLTVALDQMLGIAKANWGGLPSIVAQFMAISGVNEGLSIIAGAMVASLAMVPLKKLELL